MVDGFLDQQQQDRWWFFVGFSWWLLAGVVVGLLGGGWVFFLVGYSWLADGCSWVCLFVGLFMADGCSRCCGGFAWLMVVHGGFFWCRG